MEDPGIGEPYRDITVLGDEHIAERFGYGGVNVAGTPVLIALPETAAPIGAEIFVSAAVKSADGIRVTVDVEADWKTTLLVVGIHRRAVVDPERFLAAPPQLPK